MNHNTDFTCEIALQVANNVFLKHFGKRLTGVQELVIRGAWNKQTYGAIAEEKDYSPEYIGKDVGGNLWKKLGKALDEKVTKFNFKGVLKAEWEKSKQASSVRSRTPESVSSATENLTFPEGAVALNSPFYLERSRCESVCYETINQPGSLIRIKGAKCMGKTSLVKRILEQAKLQDKKTLYLDFLSIERSILKDLGELLRCLCAIISRELQLDNKVKEYWDADTDFIGNNQKCTLYLEQNILAETTGEIVLALDNVDKLFSYEEVKDDFFDLIRSWHEIGKTHHCWAKLKIVLAHSTEVYVPLNIHKSPFNVGVPILLEELTYTQVEHLASLHQLNWDRTRISKLMNFVGGHPYLLRLAMYHINNDSDLTIDRFIQEAPSDTGICGNLLRSLLNTVEQSSELSSALTQLVKSDESIELNSRQAYQLYSLGLVQLQNNLVSFRCKLYQDYFNRVWSK